MVDVVKNQHGVVLQVGVGRGRNWSRYRGGGGRRRQVPGRWRPGQRGRVDGGQWHAVARGQRRLLLMEVEEWTLGGGEAAHHEVGAGSRQRNLVSLGYVCSDDWFTLPVQLEEDVSGSIQALDTTQSKLDKNKESGWKSMKAPLVLCNSDSNW